MWRGLGLIVLFGLTPGAARSAEFEIVNSSGRSIAEVYLALKGERSWGPDRLSGMQPRSIVHGTSRTITDLPSGTYGLRLVDQSGRECEIDSIVISSTYRLDLTAARLRACTPSN